jgi:hypothetical protein
MQKHTILHLQESKESDISPVVSTASQCIRYTQKEDAIPSICNTVASLSKANGI